MLGSNKEIHLLKRLKKGEGKVIEELFDTFWDKLYVFAFNIVSDSNVCDDIVQEIFTDLWVRRNELEIENLRGFLFQAVKFKSLKHIRSKKIAEQHLQRINQINVHNETEEKIYSEELMKLLDESIAKLPERCREIFILSRFDHLSNIQIADKLGLSIQTVKNQLSKALERLRLDVQSVTLMLPLITSLLFFLILKDPDSTHL